MIIEETNTTDRIPQQLWLSWLMIIEKTKLTWTLIIEETNIIDKITTTNEINMNIN